MAYSEMIEIENLIAIIDILLNSALLKLFMKELL